MSLTPLTLEVTSIPGGAALRVLGHSSTAVSATFSVEVLAGSNRSSHHGTAALRASEAAVLSAITVSTATDVWEAVLRVKPSNAAPYEQIERSR